MSEAKREWDKNNKFVYYFTNEKYTITVLLFYFDLVLYYASCKVIQYILHWSASLSLGYGVAQFIY